jgi:hypothetical protein
MKAHDAFWNMMREHALALASGERWRRRADECTMWMKEGCQERFELDADASICKTEENSSQGNSSWTV